MIDPVIKSGFYWVYTSPCCQKPTLCGCFHRPPSWSVEFISKEDGVRYCDQWIPFDEFIGIIGNIIPQPLEPNKDLYKGWDYEKHYTWTI